jgi:predicted enzyme related to lactoylglutathione lyase
MGDEIGKIGWVDLTVPDADGIRDFYTAVVGWTAHDHDMGDYADYDLRTPGSGERVTGICHARGPNADLPAQWIIHVNVADVDGSVATCVELGGSVLREPKDYGRWGRIAVIRDPAGATTALVQPPAGDA